MSPLHRPCRKYRIHHAFTTDNLRVSEHSYHVSALQRKCEHIRSLPLSLLDWAQPLLLIGSDMPHLLTPVQPVCMGPANGLIAVCTRLGWTLQGPIHAQSNHPFRPTVFPHNQNHNEYRVIQECRKPLANWYSDIYKREDGHSFQRRPVCPYSSPDTYHKARSQWSYAIYHSLAQMTQW